MWKLVILYWWFWYQCYRHGCDFIPRNSDGRLDRQQIKPQQLPLSLWWLSVGMFQAIVIQTTLKKLLLFVSCSYESKFLNKWAQWLIKFFQGPSNWTPHQQLLTPRHLDSILQSVAIPDIYSLSDFTDAVIGTD